MDLTLVIPARSGSTRMTNKNIASFCGLPLTAWTVLQACQLGATRVVVSSDSEEYLEIIQGAVDGLITPNCVDFSRRDHSEAKSSSKIFDVLRAWVHGGKIATEWLGLMLPTAPIRIRADLERLLSSSTLDGHARFSCVPYEFPVDFAFRIPVDQDEGTWQPCLDGSPMTTGKTQSNSLGHAFHPTGTLFAARLSHYTSRELSFYSNAIPHVVSAVSRFDIDTFEDFEIAEGVSSSLGMDPGNPFGVQGQDD